MDSRFSNIALYLNFCRIQAKQIVCLTGHYVPEMAYMFGDNSNTSTEPPHRRRRSLNEGPVTVSIDAAEMQLEGLFTYEENPTIDHVSPHESIMRCVFN